MDSRTGRPLRLWGAILAAWIAVRFILTPPLGPSAATIFREPFPPRGERPMAVATPSAGGTASSNRFSPATLPGNVRIVLPAPRARDQHHASLADSRTAGPAQTSRVPPLPTNNVPRRNSTAIGPSAIGDPATRPNFFTAKPEKKWQIYAFSFWRLTGGGPAGLASAAQYGGSQSGIIATYRVGGGEKSDLSLLARVTTTPQNAGDRELAAGLSWRPARNIPVTLFAEYRARAPAPGAAALYLAGSVPDIALPGGFRLGGFGQAGVVHSFTAASAGGDERTAFLDAGLRGERPVVNTRPLQIALGAGAWAGGQRGSRRLDIGPAATLKTQISGQDIRLNADWRFRIAGNASPGNGPALTLSVGF